MAKWWLIAGEDVKFIKEALAASEHEDNDFNCPDNLWGECEACTGRGMRNKAIYILDTGLHTTDEIPDDFKEAGDGN